jgi:hypothetical protein
MGACLAAWLAAALAADPGPSPATGGLDLQAPPRLLEERLQLPGGIRPAEVQRELERIATQGQLSLGSGDLIFTPDVVQRALHLERGEHLQLRLNRGSARLELKIQWR